MNVVGRLRTPGAADMWRNFGKHIGGKISGVSELVWVDAVGSEDLVDALVSTAPVRCVADRFVGVADSEEEGAGDRKIRLVWTSPAPRRRSEQVG